MPFQVDDSVVHPAHGVGRITKVVTQRFNEATARLYYEVAIQNSTVWVPVEADPTSGLRSVTLQSELGRYRGVLRGRPISLIPDHRQRRLYLLDRLKGGSFQALCDVVRDLTARSWQKPLNEMDSGTLRKARVDLCQEWAASEGVSVIQATEEVDALLLEGRQTYQV